jgi:hypothetical protein
MGANKRCLWELAFPKVVASAGGGAQQISCGLSPAAAFVFYPPFIPYSVYRGKWCFAVACARGLPLYIKINIPTYSRRSPLTEKSSERVGNHTSGGRSSDCTGGVTAVRCQLRCACGSFGHSVSCTCWLLDVSRLIASRMVFRAQGESPASPSYDKREQRGSGESCNAYRCTEARKFA